jgi:O-antigen/teichoic acid export membrane protein
MVWNVDNFVISNYLDLINVATYSITFKLFAIIFSILQLVVSPLIFILAKEFGNNNWNVINIYYNRIALLVSFLSGAAWICSILFYKDIITLWVGSESVSNIEVVFFLGAYTFFLGLSYLNYGIICALDYIKFTPYIILFEGIINVSLSILFVRNFGLIGIALARFFSNFLWISWLYPILLYRYSSKRIMLNYSFILKFLIVIIVPLAIISVCVNIYIPLTFLRYIFSILIIIIYCLIVLKYTPEVIKTLVKEKLNFVINKSNSD